MKRLTRRHAVEEVRATIWSANKCLEKKLDQLSKQVTTVERLVTPDEEKELSIEDKIDAIIREINAVKLRETGLRHQLEALNKTLEAKGETK